MGVPLITQVVPLIPRPEGRLGEIVQVEIVPVTVGVWLVIATFCVNVKGDPA